MGMPSRFDEEFRARAVELVRVSQKPRRVLVVSAWHFVIGGAGLSILALIREGAPAVSWTPRFIAALAFLGLVGMSDAFVL